MFELIILDKFFEEKTKCR